MRHEKSSEADPSPDEVGVIKALAEWGWASTETDGGALDDDLAPVLQGLAARGVARCKDGYMWVLTESGRDLARGLGFTVRRAEDS